MFLPSHFLYLSHLCPETPHSEKAHGVLCTSLLGAGISVVFSHLFLLTLALGETFFFFQQRL